MGNMGFYGFKMGKISSILFILVEILLFIYPFSPEAVDLQSTKESRCFTIDTKKTVNADMSWVQSVDINRFYYPLMSRYNLVMLAMGLLNKTAANLKEHELYYDSCITISGGQNGSSVTGFGGARNVYNIKSIKQGQVFKFSSAATQGSKNGTCYNTYTDHETFLFTACCDDINDQMSWAVTSFFKRLPSQFVEAIYNHAESLGFKREYFTTLQYDSCESTAPQFVPNLPYIECPTPVNIIHK